MTPELEELARRAVACKGWRWMAGMLACTDVPLPHFGGAVRLRVVADDEAWGGPVGAPVESLPDLTDPATLGCLLALVREAHDEPQAVAVYDPEDDRWLMIGALDPEWGIRDLSPGRSFVGLTEAAALVAALEAAP